ncbi:citrate lyase holo-[acyl-carrier protein] synthase [Streptococcus hongkongensis]|nr:ACP synthase [Streptococcus uberis]
MFKEELFNGEKVSLDEMLRAREMRSYRQFSLLKDHPKKSLLSVTMNIPGAVKSSDLLEKAFLTVVDQIQDSLGSQAIGFEKTVFQKTGPEYYCLTDLSAQLLKEKMIAIEMASPIGRLMDLDVLWWNEDHLATISRKDLGLEARQCFICSADAKACGRSRKHSVLEMQEKIAQLLASQLSNLKEE